MNFDNVSPESTTFSEILVLLLQVLQVPKHTNKLGIAGAQTLSETGFCCFSQGRCYEGFYLLRTSVKERESYYCKWNRYIICLGLTKLTLKVDPTIESAIIQSKQLENTETIEFETKSWRYCTCHWVQAEENCDLPLPKGFCLMPH